MKPLTKIHAIRLTSEEVARVAELLIKAGDTKLALKVLAQASKGVK